MKGSGIIFVSMYDTKSQFISIVTGKEVSYAGFYYETVINDTQRTLVNLFNVYDGTRVKWIPLEYTLDSLIKNPATGKIILRPFSGDIARFHGMMIEAPTYRKEVSYIEVYKKMYLESLGIKYYGDFVTTAYYIINKALCSINGGQYSDEALNKGIISSSYIGKAFTIDRDVASENIRNQAITDINRECDDDIVNMVSTFLYLTESSEEFRIKCKELSHKIKSTIGHQYTTDEKMGIPLMSVRSDSQLDTVLSKDLIKFDSCNGVSAAPESIREVFLQLSNITRSNNSCVVIDLNKMIETFNTAYPDSKISPPSKGSCGAIISSGPSIKYITMKLDSATYKLPLKGASFSAFKDIQLKELIIQLESMTVEDGCINNLKREAIVELSKRNKIKNKENVSEHISNY